MDGPGGNVDTSHAILTAAADNSRQSRVPLSAKFVTVAGVTNDGDDWIILPTGVQPGHYVRGWSEVGHEIRTEPDSDIEINSENGDGTKEAAIPDTTLWRAEYVNATIGWILTATSEAGAAVSTITPD